VISVVSGGESVMAVVDFCDEKMTRAHKRAVRAKNRALDFGRNGARM
jgi:hypothetical protein